MKLVLCAGVLTLGLSHSVLAQQPCACGGTLILKPGVLLSGKTVCAKKGGERWQEYHDPQGKLIDWHHGPKDKSDPSAPVGSWRSDASSITYDYGPNAVYKWSLCRVSANPGQTPTYNFCKSDDSVTGATLLNGQVGCP